jgi:hypothetical protein
MPGPIISDIYQAHAEGRFAQQRAEDAVHNMGPNAQRSNFCQIVVLDVIHDPKILTEELISYYQHELGVSNIKYVSVLPRNTVVGRKLLCDSNESEPAMFFLPFLPSHLALPSKPGEHLWAFFESSDFKEIDLGYWCWRVTGFDHADDPNHSHAPRNLDIDYYKGSSTKSMSDGDVKPTYDFFNGVGNTAENGKRYATANSRCISGGSDAYEKILTESNASKLATYEATPRYRKRPDEIALEGSNNTLICLGTDRVDKASQPDVDPDTGLGIKRPTNEIQGTGTGRIDLVVGRGQTESTLGQKIKNTLEREELAKSPNELVDNEGDIDYINDRSRVLIAGKTLVDVNFGLNKFNDVYLQDETVGGNVSDRGADESTLNSSNSGDGAIVFKSDKVRIIARSDLVFYVTSFERDVDGNMTESDDVSKWASLAIKANGDIVIKPGAEGAMLFGGEDANMGVMGSDLPCILDRKTGKVTGPSPVTTMGGSLCTQVKGQAQFLNRMLVKS